MPPSLAHRRRHFPLRGAPQPLPCTLLYRTPPPGTRSRAAVAVSSPAATRHVKREIAPMAVARRPAGESLGAARKNVWFATDGSKRWGEAFFLLYTPFCLTLYLDIVVVLFKLCELIHSIAAADLPRAPDDDGLPTKRSQRIIDREDDYHRRCLNQILWPTTLSSK